MRTYEELVKEAITKAHQEAQAIEEAENLRFEVGKTYQTRSICNHDCIFKITITKRTEKFVTVDKRGETTRCKIHMIDGKEVIFPYGQYSMCPVFHADDIAA
mgnify:FL=1